MSSPSQMAASRSQFNGPSECFTARFKQQIKGPRPDTLRSRTGGRPRPSGLRLAAGRRNMTLIKNVMKGQSYSY